MTKHLNISEARAKLPELVEILESGLEEEVVITRHGTPVATLSKPNLQKKENTLRGKSFWMSESFNEPLNDLWDTVANS